MCIPCGISCLRYKRVFAVAPNLTFFHVANKKTIAVNPSTTGCSCLFSGVAMPYPAVFPTGRQALAGKLYTLFFPGGQDERKRRASFSTTPSPDGFPPVLPFPPHPLHLSGLCGTVLPAGRSFQNNLPARNWSSNISRKPAAPPLLP